MGVNHLFARIVGANPWTGLGSLTWDAPFCGQRKRWTVVVTMALPGAFEWWPGVACIVIWSNPTATGFIQMATSSDVGCELLQSVMLKQLLGTRAARCSGSGAKKPMQDSSDCGECEAGYAGWRFCVVVTIIPMVLIWESGWWFWSVFIFPSINKWFVDYGL